MKNSQDVTSQAMIEVALALSMAFFSLLILVLVTMKLPELTNNTIEKHMSDIDTSEKINVVIHSTTVAKQTNKALHQSSEKPQYAFYHNAQFYDQHLKILKINTLHKTKALIVAVSEHLTLQELIQLKKRIKHPNASITNLSQKWLNTLEQLP